MIKFKKKKKIISNLQIVCRKIFVIIYNKTISTNIFFQFDKILYLLDIELRLICFYDSSKVIDKS